MSNRVFVDRCLEKAQQYEREGNKAMADHWLKRAEEVDKRYDEWEKIK